jgi:polar amino acid transport system substrate-binding protein
MDSLTKQQKIIIGVLAVVVICAVVAGIAIVYYTLQQTPDIESLPSLTVAASDTVPPSNTSEPTLTPTAEPIDEVWDNIEQSGKIVVGMSADYPPFAYIDESFTIQGYDLALMREIGQRLGYPLEIKNMAFDGLFNALQLNEIDVAVAAISFTQERDKFVDFSNVYFVGQDAILARSDSTIQIDKLEDLAAYRVGVQRGSVYETLLTDELVDPGIMRPQYLITFDKPVDAANALVQTNPRVDLVMVDLQPAEVATATMEVKIIKRGLNPQSLALAIPSGAIVLQSKLNGVLMQMLNDGTLGRLALEYLDVENLIPLPTPAPTQPPETPTACLDHLALVQDLNYPDFNMTQPPQFGPGITFQKGWRIRNTGTCTWDSRYVLGYVGSNPPNSPVGGNPVPIQGVVEPGQTYDVYVTITTPYVAGIYQSFWTLRAPSGLFFGERIWAGFEVIVQETATPQPDAPQIYSFLVSPSQIAEGECTNVSWSYGGQDITDSRVFRDGELILFDIPVNGSFTDCPPGTGRMEYRMVVDSAAGGSAVARRNLDVVAGEQPTDTPLPTDEPTPTLAPTEAPPTIDIFEAYPEVIELGGSVELSWSFGGTSLVNARLFRDDEEIAFDLLSPDTFSDVPPNPGQIEYKLIVDAEFSGSTEQSIFVTVNEPEVTAQSALEMAWHYLLSSMMVEGIN